MHPHDQMIEDFQTLKPHLFTTFVRLDLREQYSFDIFEQEGLLQLWFRADDIQEVEKAFLHLSCYGVESRKDFSLLWPGRNLPLQLRMKTIRHHYLQGLFFELSYLDVGYDDYSPLLACRRFEAQLEARLSLKLAISSVVVSHRDMAICTIYPYELVVDRSPID